MSIPPQETPPPADFEKDIATRIPPEMREVVEAAKKGPGDAFEKAVVASANANIEQILKRYEAQEETVA